MTVMSGGIVLIVLVYLIIAAVVALLAYVVIRSAIRDGLRSHRLWLEQTGRARGAAGPAPDDAA